MVASTYNGPSVLAKCHLLRKPHRWGASWKESKPSTFGKGIKVKTVEGIIHNKGISSLTDGDMSPIDGESIESL